MYRERWEHNTADILLARPDLERRTLRILAHGIANVTSRIANFYHAERGLLQHNTHLPLGVLNLACDRAEPFGDGVCLTLQERVAILRTLQTNLSCSERHARREHGLTLSR